VIRASRNLLGALFLSAIAAAFAAAPALAAQPAPAWSVSSIAYPSHFAPAIADGTSLYVISVTNIGNAPSDGSPITITDNLPAGFIPHPHPGGLMRFSVTDEGTKHQTDCAAGPPVTCTMSGYGVHPGERFHAWIPFDTPASGPATVTNEVTVSGGGVAPITVTEDSPFIPDPAPFGISHLENFLTAPAGVPATEAGTHPSTFRFGFGVNTARTAQDSIAPAETIKHVTSRLPAGFVVNPTATDLCTEAQLESLDAFGRTQCPDSSAVGVVKFSHNIFGFPAPGYATPLFNMVPTPDSPSILAFNAAGSDLFIHIFGNVDPANNYALMAKASDAIEYGGVSDIEVELWGNPSDPSHDNMRGLCSINGGSFDFTCPVPGTPTPYLTMPSACSDSLSAGLELTSWQTRVSDSDTTTVKDADGNETGVTGCGSLDFKPTLKARPTTNVADSPSGLEVDLHVPQTNNQNTRATANLRDAVVTLPPGLVLNPSAGNGLDACSAAQIGLQSSVGQIPVRFSGNTPSCPEAARLGTAEVHTPLVNDPLNGAVYLAKPYDNPFNSLLAIYIVVESHGVLIKLAGHVVADPQTGQLVSTFKDNPQVPFEDFKLNFFAGPTAALRTPAACGDYSTTSQLTPYSAPQSGPPATPHDDYVISQGPGRACVAEEAQQPNAPTMDSGAFSPIAGSYTPFVFNLARQDGTQQFSKVTVSPPPGLTGKLAGTPACSEAALAAAANKPGQSEIANPSCPAASKVGVVDVAAGAGPAPYWVRGSVYMAGPYKGAPLSFAIITPATAGPFDLGTVVVRTATYIDPVSARITAEADPLPRILAGIPLDIRSAQLKLDKPNFTLNGTNCDPAEVSGSLVSTFGQVAPLSQRFQLGECVALPFKPKLALKLKGPTKRGSTPKLIATYTAKPGEANAAWAQVKLPKAAFLANDHIRTICTRVQFAVDACPAGSIYGRASVTTPLLDYTIAGNVYLRASSHELPDLVVALKGPDTQPIEVNLAGKTDSVKGALRNTFEVVPDAPVSSFRLELFGGKRGLIELSNGFCASPRATVLLTGQNGKTYDTNPVVKASCKKQRKRQKQGRNGQRDQRRSAR
jgi:uncharacterized repeat protein (TIGR01451 family)